VDRSVERRSEEGEVRSGGKRGLQEKTRAVAAPRKPKKGGISSPLKTEDMAAGGEGSGGGSRRRLDGDDEWRGERGRERDIMGDGRVDQEER
jgi:hypothetical protein